MSEWDRMIKYVCVGDEQEKKSIVTVIHQFQDSVCIINKNEDIEHI